MSFLGLICQRPSRRCRPVLEFLKCLEVVDKIETNEMTMTQTDFLFVAGLRMIPSYF